jgi:hypothetical protein
MNDAREAEQHPQSSPPETPTAELLAQIIAATERQLDSMETVPGWDVAATEFAERVRQLGPGWSDERSIVWGMVEAAMPGWARAACATQRAYEALLDGVAQTLWGNPRARTQIVALSQRIKAAARGAVE